MALLLEPLLGPLAAVESRRSLGRGWVLAVRALAALPPALVLLGVLWFWWFQRQVLPGYSPHGALVWGLGAVEAMFVTAALLLGQALLAGTLAGDGVRPTLGLLLAARVSATEIVLGRLTGRLCIVAAVGAAGLPPLVGLAALCGLDAGALATLVALPAAVAFGGGGLTLAASVAARRGRDALLMAYLVEFLLVLTPSFTGGLPAEVRRWVEPLNPYHGIGPLTGRHEPGPALTTIGLWAALGTAGCAWAARRLRRGYLDDADGPRRRGRRRARVPVLGDRPMLWKELYVEQVQTFGRLVRGAGTLAVVAFVGTSLTFAGLVAWGSWAHPDGDTASWARAQLEGWLTWSWLIAWLLQWAFGLRAAAAIAAERQHGTWDGLLVSPLEGREIVLAKVCGSVYALRALLAAVVLTWAVGLVCGALAPGTLAELVAQTLVIGAFMVAVGTAFSLHCASPTRAMTLTVVCWLAAEFVLAVLAGLLTFVVLLCWLAWALVYDARTAGAGPGPWFGVIYQAIRLALYALAAFLVAAYVRHRFDALAGRCSAAGPRPGSGAA